MGGGWNIKLILSSVCMGCVSVCLLVCMYDNLQWCSCPWPLFYTSQLMYIASSSTFFNLESNLKSCMAWPWEGGSVAKNSCCLAETRDSIPSIHGSSDQSVTPVLRNLTLSSDLCRCQGCIWLTDIYLININIKFFSFLLEL